MEEYFGLRSKLYSHKMFENGKEAKKAKSLKKKVIQKEICFEEFRKCLITKDPIYKKQNMFRTQKHDIYIYC